MAINRFSAVIEDKQSEEEYLNHEISSTIKYIRPAILVLGFIFFLFILPDLNLNEDPFVVWTILAIRGGLLILVIGLYLVLLIKPDMTSLANWISLYAFLISAGYLLIYYVYESPNLYIQSFGVVTLIIIYFNLLYNWSHAFLISIFTGSGFFLVTHLRPEEFLPGSLSAVCVYITLIILVSGISAHRLNVNKRKQYLNTKELERLSETDPLTGIYNRGKFDRELKEWIDLAKRYGHHLSIVLFDIDNLKAINDLHGHLAGDKVLKTASGLVKDTIRSTDIFARWGGDEFVVLLPHTRREQAVELAERISGMIASHQFNPGGYISCSFGAAALEEDDDARALLNRADHNLYKAKASGKNRVVS